MKYELVSGFNVEYAAGPFTLFFLAEYANIIIINYSHNNFLWRIPQPIHTRTLHCQFYRQNLTPNSFFPMNLSIISSIPL
uniref:NADH dehydrogenase subunit 1 n=1 Tax=Canis lupus familiaris TaxID=9615 RepID=A0A8I3NY62_CANLF